MKVVSEVPACLPEIPHCLKKVPICLILVLDGRTGLQTAFSCTKVQYIMMRIQIALP